MPSNDSDVSSGSSSEEDEAAARIAAVVVSAADVSREQQRVAMQGHQKLHKQSAKPGSASHSGAKNAELEALGGQVTAVEVQTEEGGLADAHKTGTDVQALGIVERRIAAALDKRLEQLMPPLVPATAGKPSSAKQAKGEKKHSQCEEDLGCGVRLFRRSKPNAPVLLPPEPVQVEASTAGHKRRLTAELVDGFKARRARAELALLQGLLPKEANTQTTNCLANQPQDSMYVMHEDRQTDAVGAEALADGFQASVHQAIRHMKKSMLPASKQAKALRRALKQSAVEGAAIILAAAVQEPAADATPVLREKKKRKKKKRPKEGAETTGEAGQPAAGAVAEQPQKRLVQVDGVVVEARKDWVPFEARTAKLMGLATGHVNTTWGEKRHVNG